MNYVVLMRYHEYRKSWENNPNSFPERKLYLCISKTNTDEEADRKYLFYFEKSSITHSADLYAGIVNSSAVPK